MLGGDFGTSEPGLEVVKQGMSMDEDTGVADSAQRRTCLDCVLKRSGNDLGGRVDQPLCGCHGEDGKFSCPSTLRYKTR